MRRLLIVALAWAASACAPSVGEGFLRAKASGDRAQSAGRYEEAARAYREAADSARRPRDRDEALFLEAGTHRRARDTAKAAAVYRMLIAESPRGERTPRASFELAWIEIETGDVDEGHAMLERALRSYPRSGPARRGLDRLLSHLEDRGGARAALAWIDAALIDLGTSALGENLRYERAKRLESLGDLEAARDAFVDCAERHPYPFGSLFDDALFRASLLDEALGRYELAISDLEKMLHHREASTFNGSYERPRYSPAQMRIAELYRDRLGDNRAARREFHKLFREHATSILRDDALWEEAKLARADGDADEACSRIATLIRELPESRYVGCARLVCETAVVPEGSNACRPYIAETYGRRSTESMGED